LVSGFPTATFAYASMTNEFLEASKLPQDVRDWMAEHMPDANELPRALVPYAVTAIIAKTLVARFHPALYFGVAPAGSESHEVARLTSLFYGEAVQVLKTRW